MVQDTPSRKLDQYIVRFPDGMRERLKAQAEENNRSLNAEIIARLEDTLDNRIEEEFRRIRAQALEAQVRHETVFEIFQFTAGILASASGNRKGTMKILADAIRTMATDNGSSARQKVIDQLASDMAEEREKDVQASEGNA